jgi:hypothetical protein
MPTERSIFSWKRPFGGFPEARGRKPNSRQRVPGCLRFIHAIPTFSSFSVSSRANAPSPMEKAKPVYLSLNIRSLNRISPFTNQDTLKQTSIMVSRSMPIRESLILVGPSAAVRHTIVMRQAMIASPEET